MKSVIGIVILSALASACNSSPVEVVDQPSFPEAASRKAESLKQAAKTAPVSKELAQAPILQEFKVSDRVRGLIGGGNSIKRRSLNYRFTQTSIPSLKFAERNAPALTARLKKVTSKFLASSLGEQNRAVSAQFNEGAGLLMASLTTPGAVAYAVPESGAFTLVRNLPAAKPTKIRDASDAVSVALEALVDNEVLQLGVHETLDVVGVTSQFEGGTSETQVIPAVLTAHRVMFGRSYAGIPVLGPPVEVTLDSDGKLAGLRKGWRELAESTEMLELASEAQIAERRDPLMVAHLTETDVSCGYAEDADPNSIQAAPGAGCKFSYSNANAADPMNSVQEDWVNAAAKPDARPLRGLPRIAQAFKEQR